MLDSHILSRLPFNAVPVEGSSVVLLRCKADLLGHRNVEINIGGHKDCNSQMFESVSEYLNMLEPKLGELMRLVESKAAEDRPSACAQCLTFELTSINLSFSPLDSNLVHGQLGITASLPMSQHGSSDSRQTYFIMLSEKCAVWFIERPC